jgi:APA family basic amino acid/polyamine antiporter
MTEKGKYSFYMATMLVVANMVGTGVFTSLGFQVFALKSGYTIIALWLLGGFVSLMGAFCYAEIATRIKKNGGEYAFLSTLYHPAVGFAAGWISMTVGFAAPIAAACILLGGYVSMATGIKTFLFFGMDIKLEPAIAIGILLLITSIQAFSRKLGAIFQNFSTTIKITSVIILSIIGFITWDPAVVANNFSGGIQWQEFGIGAFFISFYWVTYAYSGWNASAYIAGEIQNPKRNIPRSLITGTALVTLLYLMMNIAFMLVLNFSEIKGEKEVGLFFGNKIFGAGFGAIVGLIISGLLLSSISSMIITGPRVTSSLGADESFFKWFGKTNKANVPVRAMVIQTLISGAIILSYKFDKIIFLIGFTLNLFTILSVIGLFIARRKYKDVDSYKVPLYPFPPLVFILIYLSLLGYGFFLKMEESLTGLGFTLLGVIIYVVIKAIQKKDPATPPGRT